VRARERTLGLRLRLALVVLLPALAAMAVAVTGAGRSFDRWLDTQRDTLLRRPATGQVVVVEIDARSLAHFNRWPWPRSLYGKAVQRLSDAGAQVVAFDVDFSSASAPAEDQAFARAIQASKATVVLPTFRQESDLGSRHLVENLPIPVLREHAFLGSVNVFPDADGVLRSYRSGVSTAGETRPSLASYLSGVPGQAGRDFEIEYAIDPHTLPHYSFVDIVEGGPLPAALKGKRVVIGATAIELGDRYASPGYGILPGVITQALAAETLLQGAVDPTLGAAPGLAFAFVLALVIARSRRPRTNWIVFVPGVAALFAVPLALEALNTATVDVAPALALLTAATIGAVIADTALAFTKSRYTDSESGLPNRMAFMGARHSGQGFAVAVMFGRADEILAVLDRDGRAELMHVVAQKLGVAGAGAQIYRMDAGRYAWIDSEPDPAVLGARLEAAAALFRDPLILAGRPTLLRPYYGLVALGPESNLNMAYTQAILATQHAYQTNTLHAAYSEELSKAAEQAQGLLGDISSGLARREFWVAYQPKLDIASGQVIGAEALVRWSHPERGLISPDAFIPLFENEGEIEALTCYVVDRVLEDLTQWSADGLHPSVAVNVSARLLESGRFAERLRRAVAEAGVPEKQITLEITESAALDTTTGTAATLHRLREWGFRISVDDYGTGQSTLTYLRAFPAHEIKIDQGFVRQILTDDHDRILVKSTIDLAHALGFTVVAEGAETQEVLDLLAHMGCDVAQGWRIGKPVPSETFRANFLMPAPPMEAAVA